jgi:4-alpha-glucanotransferase
MNVPARESGNWGWRYRAEAVTDEVRARLSELTQVYGRKYKPEVATADEEEEE